MSSDQPAGVDIFFSYSHRDEALRDALETHLALLKREGAIRAWHDRRIGAGREWEGAIDRHLESADLVLLLISPDFIASDYCFDREMGRALERHRAGDARVVPVILRPCDWQTADFARLQALPKDGKAITTWRNRDQALVDVVRGLRSAVAELSQARGPEPPPRPAYADEATRDLSESLEAAYRLKADLSAEGRDTAEVVEKILALRRRLRQGAQLKAGDYLSDGRFQLLEKIGRGGFAQVWKAYDGRGRAQVAVKVLHGQHTDDRSRRERFFRGARHMARLQHPNVVRVIEEKCEDGEYCFFVMEYLPGGDFRQAVLDGRLSVQERLQIIVEVGEALALAHGRGVIHRDVKPHNVLLALDGSPRLTDFDLVRAADTTGGTRTAMLGTFLYASPEAMVDAKQAAEPADVYGLGMTAIFALYGADLPSDVLWELPELVAGLEVGDQLRPVLLRSVARKVEERWGTVTEFCGALREALLEESEVALLEESEAAPEQPSPSTAVAPPSPSSTRERLHEQDGSVLVYVPEGDFTLGTDEDLDGFSKEVQQRSKPEHLVHLSDFWIGKYPVTNAQFARFLEANAGQAKPEYWGDKRFNQSEQPVVGVSWLDARAYCDWAGLELPTEAQWEAAARGTDARRYPWGGADVTKQYADFGKRYSEDAPDPVGSHSRGAGPYGAEDQAGGVWEWCADEYNSKAYRDRDGQEDPVVKPKDEASDTAGRVLRGGSWANPSRYLRAASRVGVRAGLRSQVFGFRVCQSGPEP